MKFFHAALLSSSEDTRASLWPSSCPGPPIENDGQAEQNGVAAAAPPMSLERRSNLRKSAGVVVVYFILEINKHVLNYKLATHHSGQYPLPAPLLLLATEFTKLLLVIITALMYGFSLVSQLPSLRFGVPALCYMLTNLMYLAALGTVSPPVWMILIQTRTFYTAAIYKIMFGRPVTLQQALGCVLIVVSIPLAKMSELITAQQSTLTTKVVLGSQLSAVLSSAAAVSVEILLKNDRRGFAEQQMWLYLWGVLYSLVALPVVVPATVIRQQMELITETDGVLIAAAVVAAALAGLCVPVIVKNLDTIVKDYLAATNNLLLSVVTALVFPTLFKFSWVFLGSLGILFIGITMYERGAAQPITSTVSTPTLKQTSFIAKEYADELHPTSVSGPT